MTLVHEPPANLANGVTIDRQAVLQALNLNPRDPKVQALVLVCQQYGLDPVLKHAVLISGNLYVTRDGLLAVAHRTGNLDGITVEEEGEDAKEWWAKVSVHVKGQKYPYTYRGRYPKDGHQKKYGPEMAVKCAEVMALRRAFGVTGIATVEEQWDAHDSAIDAREVLPPAPDDPPVDAGPLVAAMAGIPDDHERAQAKQQFVAQFGLPADLRQSQYGDAEAWVAAVVTGPAPVVAGDGDGGTSSTGGTVPAESEEAALPEAATPVPSEPDYDALVPSFVDPPKLESAHPATLFHKAVKAALPMIPDGATDSDLRHAAVAAATDGATEDWRQAHGDGLDTATEAITQVAEGTLVMHRTALGWELRQPRPGETPVPSPLGELRAVIAKIPGLGEQRTLKRARRVAEDNGWPLPDSFEAITGPVLDEVYAEALAKLDEVGA